MSYRGSTRQRALRLTGQQLLFSSRKQSSRRARNAEKSTCSNSHSVHIVTEGEKKTRVITCIFLSSGVLVQICERVRVCETHIRASAVPEVVGKQLSENPTMQVDIPVAFLARGTGSDQLIQATSLGEVAELNYETLKHFASLGTSSSLLDTSA